MARAQGARSQLAVAFETQYGVTPSSGFSRLPFASSTLSAEQPLLSSELLGYGRDPLAPVKDAITSDGDITVPVDAEAFGFWLKAAFGAAQGTTSAAATGSISFADNPDPGDLIVLGGEIWAFVSGTPSGNETKIGVSASATITALVSDLNNSADPVISQATYAKGTGDVLEITFGASGTGGNHFTLSAQGDDLTASAASLSGGGHTHVFQTGAWALPSLSIETGMPEVPRFAMYSGAMVDQLSWTMQRSGLLTASVQLVAQGETVASTSQAGTVADLDLLRFGHFNASIKRDGSALGNVISAQVAYSNNLDRIETIRNDGMIDGADPSIAALTGSMEVRFADTTLVTQAMNGTPCEIELAYVLPSGESLTVAIHAVYLPRPRLEISGPQGVQATFDWQAALDLVKGRMATITLVNNTASY